MRKRFQPQGRFRWMFFITAQKVNFYIKSDLTAPIWKPRHLRWPETPPAIVVWDLDALKKLLQDEGLGWPIWLNLRKQLRAERFFKRCWIFCVWIPGCGNDPMAREIFGNMPWEMMGFWSQRFPKARRREQSAEAGVCQDHVSLASIMSWSKWSKWMHMDVGVSKNRGSKTPKMDGL